MQMIFKVLLLCLVVSTQARASETVKYFSMNLHCALDDWKSRVNRIIDEIERKKPDFMAFQEVCKGGDGVDMATYIVAELEKRGITIETWKTVYTHRTFKVYDEQLLLISTRPVASIESGKLPSMSPYENMFLGFQVDGRWVVTTHLHFILPSIRKDQYSTLLKVWGGKDAVVLGDMNSEPGWGESAPFTKAGWKPFFPGKTFPADNPAVGIDGFWVAPELGRKLGTHSAERLFNRAKPTLSDHLAVFFTAVYAD